MCILPGSFTKQMCQHVLCQRVWPSDLIVCFCELKLYSVVTLTQGKISTNFVVFFKQFFPFCFLHLSSALIEPLQHLQWFRCDI